MKKWYNFLSTINLILIYSFGISTIKSFGLRNTNESLLIYFIKEKSKTSNEIISEEDYMKSLMFKEIYSTFNIGSPKQNIKFYYEMNEIASSISQEFYFPKRSTTLKLIENKKNSNISQELFIFDENKKLDDFIFYLKGKFDSNKQKNFNSLGLGYIKNDSKFSFISNVHKKGYIYKKVFSFLFGDDAFSDNRAYDGQILIGSYPHDISPYFNELDLNFISLKDEEKWIIEFDSVKYNDQELKDKSAKLDVNLNIMIGPEQFRKKLISSLFYEFIENGKYQEHSFISDKDGQTYLFYTFDNNIRLKNIPSLSFFSKALNETFKINIATLFRKFKEKYYFNVLFSKTPKNIWVFGQQFFNTYNFVFDLDEGKIGYYKIIIKYSGMFITILCIILSAALFGFCYLRAYLQVSKEKNQNQNQNRQMYYPIRKEYMNQQKEVNKEIKNGKDDKPKKE